jgi:uncharacterized OsmC-like protein
VSTTEQPTEAPAYVAHVTARIGDGPDKLVTLPCDEEQVVMGVHGPIAERVGAPDGHPPRNSTLDYLVGAAVGCLAGTFARALKAREIPVDPAYVAEGSGEMEVDGGVLVLKRVTVRHALRVAPQHRATVERVHDVYHRGCAVSRSLEGAVEIESVLALEDAA